MFLTFNLWPCRDVGLVKEAEKLLYDVTSLHSVGHWPQLSSSAYSIMAHCQKKLREEDKYLIYYVHILVYGITCIYCKASIHLLILKWRTAHVHARQNQENYLPCTKIFKPCVKLHWMYTSCTCRYKHISLSRFLREVNSLIVLVTTPNYSNSAHDPIKCMDQLIHIANVSRYQKLLYWEPLFDLESIQTEPVGKLQYTMSDTVTVKFKFHFNGPKVHVICKLHFMHDIHCTWV